MSHTDPEILALRALGETAGTAEDAEHAGTCAACRSELARLTEVVQLARHDGPEEPLETPPPQVWDRIAAAVGTDLNGYGTAAPDARPRDPAPAVRPPSGPVHAGGWPARAGRAGRRADHRDWRRGRRRPAH